MEAVCSGEILKSADVLLGSRSSKYPFKGLGFRVLNGPKIS